MSDPPLLSLCIFTYNRALLLTQVLDQIVTVKNAFPQGMIEVVISDNASTDNTLTLIRERYVGHDFKIVTHDHNIGITRNWLESVKQSTGTYVWPYADDDLLDVAAVIKTIAHHLRHGTSDFYHMNYAQGVYTDNPRLSATMQQIHHGVDRDIIFPNIASLIPYCGTMSRGIIVMGNIFRGDFVREQDFEDCFKLNDMMEQVEIILKAFKHKKSALLHQCLMLHIHPPNARWFEDVQGGVPGSYVWTIALMRRMVRMIENGTIEPSLIDADGFLQVLKLQENNYTTLRIKLPHQVYEETLAFLRNMGRPLETRDSAVIGSFARFFSEPAMKTLYEHLEKLAETSDASLSAQMDQSIEPVRSAGQIVMWQATECQPYETYIGRRIDTSTLGAR
jgi:hypothetical protein